MFTSAVASQLVPHAALDEERYCEDCWMASCTGLRKLSSAQSLTEHTFGSACEGISRED